MAHRLGEGDGLCEIECVGRAKFQTRFRRRMKSDASRLKFGFLVIGHWLIGDSLGKVRQHKATWAALCSHLKMLYMKVTPHSFSMNTIYNRVSNSALVCSLTIVFETI